MASDATYVLAVEVSTQGAVADIQNLNKQIDATTDAIKKTGSTFKSGYSDVVNSESTKVSASLDKVAKSHAGVNRELLVLAHELSQGNYTKLGGSLLVLGERTDALGAALGVLGGLGTAAAVGVGAIAVAAVAVGVAFYETSKQTKEFNDALALTNNYIGLTSSNFAVQADQLANSTTISFAKASEVVLDLAKNGVTSGSQIQSLGKIIVDFSKLTGESIEKTSQAFAQLNTRPAEFIAEVNRTGHYFTAAQVELITSLEKSGDKFGATNAAAKAFTDYLNGPARDAVSNATGFFGDLGTGLSDLYTKFKQLTGIQKLPFADQLKDINDKISNVQAGPQTQQSAALLQTLNAQKLALFKAEAAEEKKVTQDQFAAYQNAAAQNASDVITAFHLKSQNQLREDLASYKRAIDTIRAQNPTDPRVQPGAVAQGIAEITKRDTTPIPQAKLTDEQKGVIDIGKELVKLDDQYQKTSDQATASLDPVNQAFQVLKQKLSDAGKGFVDFNDILRIANSEYDKLKQSIIDTNTLTVRKDIQKTDLGFNDQIDQLKAQEGSARTLVALRQQLDNETGKQFGLQTADQVDLITAAIARAKTSLDTIRDLKIGNAVTDELKDLTEQSRLLDVELANYGKTNADSLNAQAQALSAIYKQIDPEGRGKNITDEQKAQLEASVKQVEAQKQLIEQNKQITQSFSDLGNAVEDWYLGSTDGIKKVRLELIKLLALEAFKASGASTNGLVGSLVNGFISGLSGHAAGGYVKPGETVIVGDGGRPELFTAGAVGGYVTPNTNALRATAGGSSNITFHIAPTLTVYGSIVKQDELDQQFSDWTREIAKQFSNGTQQQLNFRERIR